MGVNDKLIRVHVNYRISNVDRTQSTCHYSNWFLPYDGVVHFVITLTSPDFDRRSNLVGIAGRRFTTQRTHGNRTLGVEGCKGMMSARV